MSCLECEKIQDTFVNTDDEIYIRVGTGNVQIIACSTHAQALIQTYRKGLEQIEREENGTN